MSSIADTIFKFAKTVVGVSDPSEDPLFKLRTEIIWTNLGDDTITLKIFEKVSVFFMFRLGFVLFTIYFNFDSYCFQSLVLIF